MSDWRIDLMLGDCLEMMAELDDSSVDGIVTDPPYGLGFMGKAWDIGVPAVDVFAECLRVLKPGGHLLAFGGTRTCHRLTCAVEDAGFEIRDMIAWVYGSGFPKSQNVSKAIDKAAGAERKPTGRVKAGHEGFANRGNMSSVQSLKGTLGGEGGFARPWMEDPEKVEAYHQETAPATPEAQQWDGWGTALKPALEPITVARKPLAKGNTVAANVLEHGTGAINVDGCRVEYEDTQNPATNPLYRTQNGYAVDVGSDAAGSSFSVKRNGGTVTANPSGRWPANLIHDGSDEVTGLFPVTASGVAVRRNSGGNTFGGDKPKPAMDDIGYGDTGSAARFFYCAKASKKDRGEGNKHPTVKPTDLMRYLCRLVTPPGGIVLDPFMGSGSTGRAALLEGFRFVGIEKDEGYFDIAEGRILAAKAESESQDDADRAGGDR